MGKSERQGGDDTLCPITRSTDLMGDRWSIVIVRELLLGQTRFQDLQVQTGATSQMLAARLKALASDGLVERQAYSTRPLRHGYRLTAKGIQLMPVILALRAWGERWCKPEGQPLATHMFHRICGAELDLEGGCPTCGGLVPWVEMAGRPGEAWAEERNRRAADFIHRRRDTQDIPRELDA